MASPTVRLLSLAKPHWRQLLLGTVFLAIGSAMNLVYPQLIRRLIDGSLGQESPDSFNTVDHAALIMLAVFLVDGVASGLRYHIFTSLGEYVVTQLRERLYRAIIEQELAFFDGRRTGELMNRLSSDTTVLQNTVSVNISMTLRSLASTLGGLGLLLYTSPILTGLMLIVVPVVVIGATIFGRKVRVLSREVQDAYAKTGDVAEETFSGIRTVRAFAHELGEAHRYNQAVQHTLAIVLRRVKLVAWFSAGGTFAGYSAVAIVLWYGGHLVLRHEMSLGELTAFLLYTLIVAVSLGTLGGLWTDFMRAVGATERVFELLEREPAIANHRGAIAQRVEGRVSMHEVAFRYPTRPDAPVLHGISFDLEPGERIALVGPSGGGKSTIASLLMRMYDVDTGFITLDNQDIRALKPDWLRTQIGSVAQEPILFSMSIADNIRYGRDDASQEDVETAAKAANAHSFVSAFPDGYATHVGERGVQLSGGQKQRIAIARAVLKDPKLLILDEATSALDAESEHLVKEALERLMQGRTTLIIAHRLSTVKDADAVLVLEGGRVVERGTHEELMRDERGLYRRLVERQFARGP